MKRHQATRKMQVTIPKKLAEKKGIRPGDVVVFEEARDDSIIIKKVAVSGPHLEEVRSAIDMFVKEAPKVMVHVQAAGSGLNESLSRPVNLPRAKASGLLASSAKLAYPPSLDK